MKGYALRNHLTAVHAALLRAKHSYHQPLLLSAVRHRRYAKGTDAELSDKDRRNKEIRAEMDRGYFGDVREYNQLKGKLFVASKSLAPAKDSPKCPEVSATTLNSTDIELTKELAGKVTLLCVGCRDFAMPQLKTFVGPFEERFGDNPAYQAYQLSLVDKWAWRMFAPLMRSSLRGTIPESQWNKFAMGTSGVEQAKKAFGITNSLFGYVYLVDKAGLIRWRAAGEATPEELITVEALAKLLDKGK